MVITSTALRRKQHRAGAFTLIEVLVSLGVLTLVAGSVSWSLTQLNFSAASNRIYTCAQTIVQNEIDAFLSAEPYSPRHIADDGTAYPRTATPLIPAALTTGTFSTGIVTPTTGGLVTIYTDPASGGTLTITGTLSRTVTDQGLTQTTNSKTDSLDVRSLSVTLNYTFKGKAYTVSASTLRTSDFER